MNCCITCQLSQTLISRFLCLFYSISRTFTFILKSINQLQFEIFNVLSLGRKDIGILLKNLLGFHLCIALYWDYDCKPIHWAFFVKFFCYFVRNKQIFVVTYDRLRCTYQNLNYFLLNSVNFWNNTLKQISRRDWRLRLQGLGRDYIWDQDYI